MRFDSADAKLLAGVAKRIDVRHAEIVRFRQIDKAVGQFLDALETEIASRDERPGAVASHLGQAFEPYTRMRAVHDGFVEDFGTAEQLGLTPQ